MAGHVRGRWGSNEIQQDGGQKGKCYLFSVTTHEHLGMVGIVLQALKTFSCIRPVGKARTGGYIQCLDMRK